MNDGIDIKENRLYTISDKLLPILLKDMTTGKNIIWATDIYSPRGDRYKSSRHIEPELITGRNGNVIRPRVEKSKHEQSLRVKAKAEVFTPSWICNCQNNLVDNSWFEKEAVFNTEIEKNWITNKEKIIFSNTAERNWQSYVKANRLEITCGEAPYLTSRYDAVTGEYIEVQNRIGLLDRKLRVVSENTDNEETWLEWAKKAVMSCYGYDYQGDNVLLSRENLLFTVLEYYENKFSKQLQADEVVQLAKIISWNIWQMDGLKFVVPDSCVAEKEEQLDLFAVNTESKPCEGCKRGVYNIFS